jgi:outer membrane immunogenic protein
MSEVGQGVVMKKLVLGSLVLAAMMVGPAVAADKKVKPVLLKAPPKEVAYNWTGCYVGVNGGVGWQENHSNDIVIFTGGLGAVVPFPESSLGPNGGFGGGQVGCNYQTNQVVFGLEGDIQASDIHDSFGPQRFTVPGILTITASQKLDWFGTVRGRLGYAQDRLLFYVTGGVAFGKTLYSQFSFDSGNNTDTLNGDSSHTGYAVGGGLEWAATGALTGKLEYQYLNFGSIGPLASAALSPAGIPTGARVTMAGFRNDYSTIRIGLNYKFNPVPAGVAVKY